MKTKLIIAIVGMLSIQMLGFGQNTDWKNAPLNPIPRGADLKYKDLKGSVLQESILNYYTRDGKWFSFDGNEKIKKDAQGRVVEFVDNRGNVYGYKYDSKGNLVESSYNSTSVTTYVYDAKNRLIKENYKDAQNKTRSNDYTYSTKGDILVLNLYRIDIGGTKVESEKHFKNGLEILEVFKEYPSVKYEYQFDQKGNWISKTFLDASTNKPKISEYDNKPIKPVTRDIIYYDEYDKGLNNYTLVLNDIYEGKKQTPFLIPRQYINGKELKIQLYTRFFDDYVFYDPFSNNYYNAPNTYAKTHKDGDTIPFEKLVNSNELILLYNGTNIKVFEPYDREGNFEDWKTTNYTRDLNAYISVHKKDGRAFVFENLPVKNDTKLSAVSGKSISGPWYVTIGGSSTIFFENGNYVEGPYEISGYIANSATFDPVISVKGVNTYVLTNYDSEKLIYKKFYQARKFNPSTDKIQSNSNSEINQKTPANDKADSEYAKSFSISKNQDGTMNYFQNNQKIKEPDGYIEDHYGNDVFYYDPGVYYFFDKVYKSLIYGGKVMPGFVYQGETIIKYVGNGMDVYYKGEKLAQTEYLYVWNPNAGKNILIPSAQKTYTERSGKGNFYNSYYFTDAKNGINYLEVDQDKNYKLIVNAKRIPNAEFELKVNPANSKEGFVYQNGKKTFKISNFDKLNIKPDLIPLIPL